MIKQNQSSAEIYAEVLLTQKEPAYYAQVPSSVFYCTYIETDNEGNRIRKKLSSNAIALYTLLRSVAGSKGACWMNTKHLAELLGRSPSVVSESKKELQQPMEQLNDKPLISIENKTKRRMDSTGGTKYHVITIEFIWPENNAFMATRKHWTNPNVHNSRSDSDIESENSSDSDIESEPPGSRSDIEPNNRIQKKNHSVTEEPPGDAGDVCLPIGTDSVNSVQEEYRKQRERTESQLRKFGCDNNFIKEMLKRFTPKRILNGGIYTCEQLKRKAIGNRFGYLRRAIEDGREWIFTEN